MSKSSEAFVVLPNPLKEPETIPTKATANSSPQSNDYTQSELFGIKYSNKKPSRKKTPIPSKIDNKNTQSDFNF